jgi:hypothetical protein
MVPAMSTSPPPVLKLRYPETLVCGEHSVRVGGATFRALSRLLRARPDARGNRRVKLGAFVKAVWGERVPPDATLRGLVFRVNELLRGIGCGSRLERIDVRGEEFVALTGA